ncbi:MAG TPA: hypothetical protein VJC39_04485 [Candidatus Nanoarchaeia archaeon]|nr:hypothetical protein [Candidatus Nanoarchaeia archaeon]
MRSKQFSLSSWPQLLHLLPRIISVVVLVEVLVLIIVLQFHLILGVLSWVMLLLITLVAWKDHPLGGALFLLASAGAAVSAMISKVFYLNWTLVLPLLATGVLYITHHLHHKPKDRHPWLGKN